MRIRGQEHHNLPKYSHVSFIFHFVFFLLLSICKFYCFLLVDFIFFYISGGCIGMEGWRGVGGWYGGGGGWGGGGGGGGG